MDVDAAGRPEGFHLGNPLPPMRYIFLSNPFICCFPSDSYPVLHCTDLVRPFSRPMSLILLSRAEHQNPRARHRCPRRALRNGRGSVAPLRFNPVQERLFLMESSRTSNRLSRKHVRHPRGMLINYILQDRILVNHT